MSFTVPDFGLTCDVYSGPWLTKVFRFTTPCNLALSKRTNQSWQDFDVPEVAAASLVMTLLLPPGTDLQDKYMGLPNDVIECPPGSGRWYGLQGFDDVGKGYANEYRIAYIVKIGQAVDPVKYAGLFWPTPVP